MTRSNGDPRPFNLSMLVLFVLSLIPVGFAFTINKRGACGSKSCEVQNRCSENLKGETLLRKYRVYAPIDKGTENSRMFSAQYDGGPYLIKCFKSDIPQAMTQESHESKLLSQLNHPNILQIQDSIQYFNQVFLVYEYGETFLASDYWAKELKLNLKEVYTQILDAVIFMHSKNIYHRNLNPSNIILKTGKDPIVKITGFDYATTEKQSKKKLKFTPAVPYVSKEVYLGKSGDWDKNDVSALGGILFKLLLDSIPGPRRPPPTTNNGNMDISTFQSTYNFSFEVLNWFRIVFYSPPEKRPTAAQLKEMFLSINTYFFVEDVD